MKLHSSSWKKKKSRIKNYLLIGAAALGIGFGYLAYTEKDKPVEEEFKQPEPVTEQLPEAQVDAGSIPFQVEESGLEKIAEEAYQPSYGQKVISTLEQAELSGYVENLYKGLILAFPETFSVVFDKAKEHKINPSYLAAQAILEGGLAWLQNLGVSEEDPGRWLEMNDGKPTYSGERHAYGLMGINYNIWQGVLRDELGIESIEGLADVGTNIDAALLILNKYVEQLGNLSDAYTAYTLGLSKVLNVREKYANGERGKAQEVLKRWAEQGIEKNSSGVSAYEKPANYNPRIQKMAGVIDIILEKSGIEAEAYGWEFDKTLQGTFENGDDLVIPGRIHTAEYLKNNQSSKK